MKNYVSWIRENRLKLHISQAELSAAVGASRRSVSDWDAGRSCPSDEYWGKLVEFFKAADAGLGLRIPARKESTPKGRPRSSTRKIGKLEEKRLATGMTRDEVAAAIGAGNAGVICSWELGKHKPIKKYIARLADLFGCTPDEIGFPSITNGLTVEERNRLAMEHLNLIGWVANRNQSMLKAAHADLEDVRQDMAVVLVESLNTFDAGKGKLVSYVIQRLQYEAQHSATRAHIHGITGLPAGCYPGYVSLEALTESGFQIADRRQIIA